MIMNEIDDRKVEFITMMESYKQLVLHSYIFFINWTKKGKPLFKFLYLHFDRSNFRHLIIGSNHLRNYDYIECNSKLLFDILSDNNNSKYNEQFELIIKDDYYELIVGRIKGLSFMSEYLKSNDFEIYEKPIGDVRTKINYDYIFRFKDDLLLFLKIDDNYKSVLYPVSIFVPDNVLKYIKGHGKRNISELYCLEIKD